MELLLPIILLVFYLFLIAGMLIVSLISSLVMCALIGGAPLISGLMIPGKKKLGIIGFIACFAIASIFGEFLALLASLIFIFFIVKGQKEKKSAEPAVEEVAAEEPATEE